MPWKELGYAIGFIVVLAALYVGAYYAMVEERVRGVSFPIRFVSYRFGEEWAKRFFSPAHTVDRQIRPDFWDD